MCLVYLARERSMLTIALPTFSYVDWFTWISGSSARTVRPSSRSRSLMPFTRSVHGHLQPTVSYLGAPWFFNYDEYPREFT